MSCLQFVGKPPRRLGDDLKAADDGVERLKIVAQTFITFAVCELFGEVNMTEDVAECASFSEGIERIARGGRA